MNDLANQVIAFFKANPGEQLDAECISVKFDCDRGQVHTSLATAVRSEMLCRFEDLSTGELVYSAGVKSFTGPQNEDDPKPRKRRAPLRSIDVNAVTIEKGIPVPTRVRGIEWQALLTQLEVGDSFALPPEANKSIQSALTACRKATGKTFTRRLMKECVRVWRVS